MMQIKVEGLGKRFNREWIFRNLDFTFSSENSYAIIGPNGSGKSTLLQVLAGVMPSTQGKISYQLGNQVIGEDDFFKYLTIAAPYLELIEEFTLLELVTFHKKFKPFRQHLSPVQFIQQLWLEESTHKLIRNFSSGMKQRVKLGLAFYSDVPVVMLDEPTANLDATGIAWYRQLVNEQSTDRLLLIGSNQPTEYDFCSERLEVQNFKV